MTDFIPVWAESPQRRVLNSIHRKSIISRQLTAVDVPTHHYHYDAAGKLIRVTPIPAPEEKTP